MYSTIQLARKYLRYYFTASGGKGHGIHSPFMYELITRVIDDKRDFYAFAAIEELRAQLLRDHSKIKVEDFGAGSAKNNSTERKISEITRSASKPARFGKLLFRIANYYQCNKMLELGASLGISASYLASANQKSRLITLEGAHKVAVLARNNFQQLLLHNIELIEGNFDGTLASALERLGSPDLVFFDGNHKLEPTLRYFDLCLSYSHLNSIFIFDDIHWSYEMEQAWETIKQNDKVTCTVDLFFMGLVFFRDSIKEKQHFVVRF